MERIVIFELPIDNLNVAFYVPENDPKYHNVRPESYYRMQNESYKYIYGTLQELVENDHHRQKIDARYSRQSFVGSNEGLKVDETVRKCKKFSTMLKLENEIYDLLETKAQNICPSYLKSAIYNGNFNDWEVLLYETGGFFKPHTDTKTKYTLATCLIFPPATDYNTHTGGKLKITNTDGSIFEFESDKVTKWTCVMFEPTLVHECEEVLSGNRFVLKNTLIYSTTLYDLLSSSQSNLLTWETLQNIQPRHDLPNIDAIKQKIIKEFKDTVIKLVNDIEYDIDNIEELKRSIESAHYKSKCQFNIYEDKYTRNNDNVIKKIDTNTNTIVTVVLPSFYHDLIPANLYSDDLKLVKQIIKKYPNTSLKNISSKIIDSKLDDGKLYEIQYQITKKNKYLNLWNNSYENNDPIIWINGLLNSGNCESSGSEYNDSTYDSIYYMNYSCIVINKVQ